MLMVRLVPNMQQRCYANATKVMVEKTAANARWAAMTA
jgi:hypothetical protein